MLYTVPDDSEPRGTNEGNSTGKSTGKSEGKARRKRGLEDTRDMQRIEDEMDDEPILSAVLTASAARKPRGEERKEKKENKENKRDKESKERKGYKERAPPGGHPTRPSDSTPVTSAVTPAVTPVTPPVTPADSTPPVTPADSTPSDTVVTHVTHTLALPGEVNLGITAKAIEALSDMTTAVLDVVTPENARNLAVAASRSEVGKIAMHSMYGLAFAFILQLPLADPSPASVPYQGAKALAFLCAILCDSTGQELNKFSVYAATIAIARLAVENGNIQGALRSLANTKQWIADPSGPINRGFQSAIDSALSAYTSLSQYFVVGPIIMVNIETFCGAMRNTIVSFASNLKELLNNNSSLFVLPVLCTLFVVGALLIIMRARHTIMAGFVRARTGTRRLLGSITTALGKIRWGISTKMSVAVLAGIVTTASFAMIASTGLQPSTGWLDSITTPTAYSGSILEQTMWSLSWAGPHRGTLNEFARVVSKIPDPDYIHKWIEARITDLFAMAQSAFSDLNRPLPITADTHPNESSAQTDEAAKDSTAPNNNGTNTKRNDHPIEC
jgi:hypothetical protein